VTTTGTAAPVAVSGDETTRLYAKYGDQLYRYCVARLRSREDAEDAVQSTFIRVHGALQKGVTPRFEAAWLYKIAHNVCLSRSEVTGRRAQHETPQDLAALEWTLPAPETPRDELIGLSEALGSMPKKLRDPILLREWQGLSYAEIATALDTSVSAVETLIFRGRRHLAAALAPAPKRPRRVLSGLFDAGTAYSAIRLLLAQLRGLLIAAGPLKVAAGAAVIAVAGGGIELAAVSNQPTPPAARTPSVQLVSATPVARTGPARSPVTTHVAGARTRAGSRSRAVVTTFPPARTPVAPTSPGETPPAVIPSAGAPPADVIPTVTTTAPTPAVPDVPAVPAVPSVPAVPVPTLTPPVQAPVVTVPTLAAPAVDTSGVPIPQVSATTVTVPATTPPLPVTVPG
jgi:RNA polymerase sigma factor (sigma-70 family)